MANYLKMNGVNAERLTAVGYGETLPVADNTTAEGRSENRRVSFVIVPNEKMKEDALKEAGQE